MSWYDEWEDENEDKLEELGRAHYANYRKGQVQKRLEEIKQEKEQLSKEINENLEKYPKIKENHSFDDEDMIVLIDAEIELLQKRKKFHQLKVEEKTLLNEQAELNHEFDL